MIVWCPLYELCLLEVSLAMQSSTCSHFVNFFTPLASKYNSGLRQLVVEQVLVFGMKLVDELYIQPLNEHEE